MNQDKLRILFIVLSVVCAVLFVGLLIFGIVFDAAHVITTVLIFVLAVVSLALACEFGYLFIILKSAKPNFFLYDTAAKKNISVDNLTFATVNSRMNNYFSGFASSEGKLWTDKILENTGDNMSNAFKPIVAYKLLFDLANMDKEIGWTCFDLASVETVEFICAALESNNDGDFASLVRDYKNTNPTNIPAFREFLISNKMYLQKKMYKYVCTNIELFNNVNLV